MEKLPHHRLVTNVVIVTNSFPFLVGEEFLEEEVKHWAKEGLSVTILPLQAKGEPRVLPAGIKVDRSLTQGNDYRLRLLLCAPVVLTKRRFYREMAFLFRNDMFRYKLVREAVVNLSVTLLLKRALNKYIAVNGTIDVLYSYWNDVSAYAACCLKASGGIGKLVSRVHGYDLYIDRRMSHYMPLKWQFTPYFDKVYAISPQGKDYFVDNFHADPKKVVVSPLGIVIDKGSANKSVPGRIHIVSVSFCIGLKRIDKIIDAVLAFSARNPNVDVLWTHIGGGPLRSILEILAADTLGHVPNVTYSFKGHLANKDVRRFLHTNCIDVFVNASESEGVPVSIMEAMGSGIPVVAPDIGGVSGLVSDERGRLLGPIPSSDQIAEGISAIYFNPHVDRMRAAAKAWICFHFNAERNYPKFINSVCSCEGFDVEC